MARRTFSSDVDIQLSSEPTPSRISATSVGHESGISTVVSASRDYGDHSLAESDSSDPYQILRATYFDNYPDQFENQSVGSSNIIYLATPSSVNYGSEEYVGLGTEPVEAEIDPFEMYMPERIQQLKEQHWVEMKNHAATYRRWETLIWWEHVNRVYMLKCSTSAIALNNGLRAIRVAYHIPRENLYFGKRLGGGAFGQIFLVYTDKGKKYALKILTCDFNEENFFKLRLERDAMLLLSHENIISIKATWHILTSPSRSKMYIVMEYAKYGNVRYYINKTRARVMASVQEVVRRRPTSQEDHEGTLRTQRQLVDALIKIQNDVTHKERRRPYEADAFRAVVLRFSTEFMQGMDYMLTKGIYHDDLSLDNILIGEGFHIKIADFGLTSINHPLYQNPPHTSAESFFHQRFPSPVPVGDKEYNFTFHFLIAISTGLKIIGAENLFILRKALRIQRNIAMFANISSALFVDPVQKDVGRALECFSVFTYHHCYKNPFHATLEVAELFSQHRHKDIRRVDISRFVDRLYRGVDAEDATVSGQTLREEIEKGIGVRDLWNSYLNDSITQSP